MHRNINDCFMNSWSIRKCDFFLINFFSNTKIDVDIMLNLNICIFEFQIRILLYMKYIILLILEGNNIRLITNLFSYLKIMHALIF